MSEILHEIIFFKISSDVFGVDLMWKQMENHTSVFGLTRKQAYTEAQLDDNQQEHRFGIMVIGFE